MSLKVQATDRDGGLHELAAEIGQTVMETLRDAGLPVEAICGGCCSCATCHVYVARQWLDVTGPRGIEETELLQLSEHFDAETSRLGCQLKLNEQHNGMAVTLAPEE